MNIEDVEDLAAVLRFWQEKQPVPIALTQAADLLSCLSGDCSMCLSCLRRLQIACAGERAQELLRHGRHMLEFQTIKGSNHIAQALVEPGATAELAMMSATNTVWNGTNDQVSHLLSSTPYTYWNHYPVYVTVDKTKKAIDILKALQADKQIHCTSVTKFIELVDKIAQLL